MTHVERINVECGDTRRECGFRDVDRMWSSLVGMWNVECSNYVECTNVECTKIECKNECGHAGVKLSRDQDLGSNG